MDLLEFTDRINTLTARVRDLKDHATTEESTKNALINPFLTALGYDTTDPRVVQFEYTADVGSKKGEKVDYAVIRNSEIIFLIEAKKVGSPLDSSKASQLQRYFNATPSARIALLTDGIVYEFYSDLESSNMMDKKPFMVFDFDNIDDKLISELHKMTNIHFDIDAALLSAQNLKLCTQLKQELKQEFANPSPELIKLLASRVTDKVMRANVIDEFKPKIKRAFAEYINEELMNRIKGVPAPVEVEEEVAEEAKVDAIITTQEEIEAFMIVKSILRKDIPLSKIAMRDAQSYCSVLFDDNNRKPICRFQFGTKLMFIHIFADRDNPEKIKIESVDDIFMHSDLLVSAAKQYME